MACGGVGSDTIYTGTVVHVVKSYGIISLHKNTPVPSAYFDQASVGVALNDLTERFKKGSQICARIAVKKGRNKIKYKALRLKLANSKQDSPRPIRGGDHFLRKYIRDNGPVKLEDLVDELRSAKGCPKLLRDGDEEDIKQIVASKRDWFEIKHDSLCLCEMENEITKSILTHINSAGGKLCINSFDNLLDCNLDAYLGNVFPVADGYKFKDFVSRHAVTFIYWDDYIWKKDNLLNDQEQCSKFQKDLKAVKYYAQFVVDSDRTITRNSLSGHRSQASDDIKKIVSTKSSEFNSFLKRNAFFFDFGCDGDLEDCPQHRIDVINQYWLSSVSAIPRTSQNVQETPIHLSGRDVLQRLLKNNGAIRSSILLSVPELSGISRQQLSDLCQRSEGQFSIRNDFLCYTSLEDYLVIELFKRLEKGAVPILDMKSLFPDGSEARRYLLAPAENEINAVKLFLERNAHWFLVYDNHIHRYNDFHDPVASVLGQKKKFQCEMKAVLFFSRFIDDDSATEIVSLRGHYAQDTENVCLASIACDDDFKSFLKRNYFFFEVEEEMVTLCNRDRLKVFDQYWLNENAINNALGSKPPVSSYNAQTYAQAVQSPVIPASSPLFSSPMTFQAPAPVKIPVQVSKAFGDADAESNTGKPISTQEAALPSDVTRLNLNSTTTAQASLLQSHISSRKEPSKSTDSEAQIFKKLVGSEISRAIQETESDLNCLLLLRLNIGKSPMAKFRIPGESGGYNQMLNVDPIKSEDVQKMLRYEEVMKMDAPLHYGIKGTLHSIRTMGQTGKLTGLTLFCQLHELNDGLGLDIWSGKKLTAVFNGNYPVKSIYNYLRCKSELLSRRGDVLVIDVDGQLSGCDEHPHPSLGNVTRMLCPSSLELSQVIMDTVQHMHEYVIVIGIDSQDQLKAIQKMCNKDTHVIAEIASDLKSEVERIFC